MDLHNFINIITYTAVKINENFPLNWYNRNLISIISTRIGCAKEIWKITVIQFH